MYLPSIKLWPVLRGMWRGAGEDRLEGAARTRGIKAKSTEKRMAMVLEGCGTSLDIVERGFPDVCSARAAFRPLQRQHLDYLSSRQSREPHQGAKLWELQDYWTSYRPSRQGSSQSLPIKRGTSVQRGSRRCYLELQPSCVALSIVRVGVQPRRKSYLRSWREESLAARAAWLNVGQHICMDPPDYPIICRATASAIGKSVFE